MTLKKFCLLIFLCAIISTGCLKENTVTNLKNSSAATSKELSNDKSKEESITKPKEESKNIQSSIKSTKDSSLQIQEGETLLGLSENDHMKSLKVYAETVYGGNKAAKLTLSINDSTIAFESNWNDGLYISSGDFDLGDKDVDVFITETGTDIECTTYIFKYDGSSLYEYASFHHFSRDLFYDGHGNIYFSYGEGAFKENGAIYINKSFDYNEKKVKDIDDESLKNKLKELNR